MVYPRRVIAGVNYASIGVSTRASPDWIGFGFSAKPEREFAYTPDAFVTALAEFILALEIERFSLVVQGFLGSVGLQYALRYSDQIGLAILNTPISTGSKVALEDATMRTAFSG